MAQPIVTILDWDDIRQYAVFKIVGVTTNQELLDCVRDNASVAGLGLGEYFIASYADLTPCEPMERTVYIVTIRRRQPGDVDAAPEIVPDDSAMNVPRYF